MPYTWEQIALTAVVLFLGGLLQSTVGFAYGLFAIPLILWLQIPIEQVLAIVLFSTFVQGLVGIRTLKEPLPWRQAITASIIRISFVVVGVLLLEYIVNFDKTFMQLIMGIVLIVSVLFLWSLPERKSDHVQFGLFYSAITPVSGLIGGMVGMGGPPMLLWALSQPWEQRRIRAFLFFMFMSAIPVQIPIIAWRFGSEVWWGVLLAIVCLPAIFIGSKVGIGIGNKLNRDQLKICAYIILLILGARSVYNYLSIAA